MPISLLFPLARNMGIGGRVWGDTVHTSVKVAASLSFGKYVRGRKIHFCPPPPLFAPFAVRDLNPCAPIDPNWDLPPSPKQTHYSLSLFCCPSFSTAIFPYPDLPLPPLCFFFASASVLNGKSGVLGRRKRGGEIVVAARPNSTRFFWLGEKRTH